MKLIEERVAGERVEIHVLERPEDLEDFREFIRNNLKGLAFDTETTGLDIYSTDYKLRLAQFGTRDTAYVIPVELFGAFEVIRALKALRVLVIQNASFDLQVVQRCLGVPMEELWPKVKDTKIYAHLVDSRGREEGGTGTSLEDITRVYIDAGVADRVKGSMTEIAKSLKTTKAKVWKVVPLDHHGYNLYAGMDPILTTRAAEALIPRVPVVSRPLISFEHELAEIMSYYERGGFLLDEEYTTTLRGDLIAREEVALTAAFEFGGLENVNSTEQVADAFESLGVRIKGRTPSGKRQVDKKFLEEQLKSGGKPGALAEWITEAKKAHKWRTTWVESFLNGMDADGRCHASINPLRARTARMSITGIPAQTLPSGDWMIRRCFIADPGQSIVSVDYQAQELRILAALSGDVTMIQAFRDGWDLHLMTAQAAWGDWVTKESKERKYAKVVNFGRVYGGGAKTVAEQTGLSFPEAKRVVEAFDKRYPGVKKLSDRLMYEAQQQGYIVSPSGRVMYVDRDRGYAAMNYMVQGTGRDVTARGIVKLHKAGFTPYMRLPIHDETLSSLPTEQAEWGGARIAELMAEQMGPVFIGTDAEVGGRSWGSLYGAEV
jgi:DNA polymerase I-like protein with 3'-5' exonuclease and polymerase domains